MALLALVWGGQAVAQTAADALRSRLAESSTHSILYGHQDDPVYGHTWRWEEGRSDVLEVSGRYPDVMGFDLGHLELGADRNLDGVPFDRMRQEIIRQHGRGGITTLSWHATNPLIDGGTAWIKGKTDGTADEKAQFDHEAQTVASILPGGASHQKFIGWLDRVSNFLLSLRDADGRLIPVILRPWHEHTGSWFWWGECLCTADEYKALWRTTAERLKARGVTNVIYAYSPGSEYVSQQFTTMEQQAGKYLERYPGDDIVDLLGLDTYCMASDGSQQEAELKVFQSSLTSLLDVVCHVAADHGKLAALTETGYESLPAKRWWTGTLLPALQGHRLAYVLTWRNAHDNAKHFYAPFPGQQSANDFKRFLKRIR